MNTGRSGRVPFAGIVLVSVLGLYGCTSTHQGRQSLADLQHTITPAVELEGTPFFPQTRHHCGPAALATVLQSHDVNVTPDMLISQVYLPQRRGSLQVELAAAARRHGMLPYPLDPELSALLREIAAGNPVLVLQNLRFDWWPQWHYAVVIGYDVASGELILRSGTTRRWQTTFAAFENTWKRADRWALVIVPASAIPETASAATYLKTAYAFEETGLTGQAADAYRAATGRWPEDTTAWLLLANIEYAGGNIDKAVAALLKAAALSPQRIATWNNLAYALHNAGCFEQALHALQCAYRIAPDDSNVRDSELEIRNMTRPAQAKNCPQLHCS